MATEKVLRELFIKVGFDERYFDAGLKEIKAAVNSAQGYLDKLNQSFDSVAKVSGNATKRLSGSVKGMAESIKENSKKAVNSFTDMKDKLVSGAHEVKSAFDGLKAGFQTLSKIGSSVSKTFKYISDLTSDYQSVGVAAKAYNIDPSQVDGWRNAYKAAGSSADEADSTLKSMQGAIDNPGNSDNALTKLAKALDVHIDRKNGNASSELKKILQALGEVKDPHRRRSLAQDASISDAVLEGAAPGGTLLKNQADFSQHSVMTPSLTDGANTLQLSLTQLDSSFDAVKETLFVALMPAAKEFLDILNDWAKWLQAHPQEVKQFADNLSHGIEEVIKWLNKGAVSVGGWGNVIETLVGLKLAAWAIEVTSAIRGLMQVSMGGTAGIVGKLGVIGVTSVISEPFIDGILNKAFGDNASFQKIRTAQTWGDFGNAITDALRQGFSPDNLKKIWGSGRGTGDLYEYTPYGSNVPSAAQHAQSAKRIRKPDAAPASLHGIFSTLGTQVSLFPGMPDTGASAAAQRYSLTNNTYHDGDKTTSTHIGQVTIQSNANSIKQLHGDIQFGIRSRTTAFATGQ